jgi:hypothetical protein
MTDGNDADGTNGLNASQASKHPTPSDSKSRQEISRGGPEIFSGELSD